MQEMAGSGRALGIYIAADEDVQVSRLAFADQVHGVFGLLGFAVGLLLALGVEWAVVHARAGEDAGQGIVIFGRDRIVLVVVAAGAGNGEREQAATDDIDAIFPLL